MPITSTCNSASLLPLTRTPALTTSFTPPAWCSSRFHAAAGASSITYGWQDEVDPAWYSCMPPEWDSTACQSLTFSPALACPHGWTIDAAQSVMGPGRSSVTFATCCMSGFKAALYWDGEKCVAPVVNYPLVVLATASSGGFLGPLATSVSTVTMEKGSLDHRAVVIGWQADDMPKTTSRPVSTGGLGSAPAATGISPPPSGAETETKGLSSGAIAGIAIGVVAAVGLVVLGVILLWRRRRREVRGPVTGAAVVSDTGAAVVSDMGVKYHAGDRSPTPPLGYGDVKPVYQPVGGYELGDSRPGELGNQTVYEMPGR